MGVGDTYYPTISCEPINSTNREFTLKVKNGTSIVKIEDGKIKALRAGSAVVQASSTENPDIIAECAITVLKKETIPNNIEQIMVLKGSATTLSEVALPDSIATSYEWLEPQTDISEYSDVDFTFECIHKEEGREDNIFYSPFPVSIKFTECKGVYITNSRPTLYKSPSNQNSSTLSFKPNMSNGDISENDMYQINYELKETSRLGLIISSNVDNEYQITANESTGIGRANLSATIKITKGNKIVFSKTYNYSIQIADSPKAINYECMYQANAEDNQIQKVIENKKLILDESTGILTFTNLYASGISNVNNSVSITSKNSKIAKVGKNNSVQICGYGSTVLTLTANADKTLKEEIYLVVRDMTPILSTNALTWDKSKKDGIRFDITKAYKTEFSNVRMGKVTFGNKEYTPLWQLCSDENAYALKFNTSVDAENTSKGTYKIEILADVNERTYSVGIITVKIIEQRPTVTMKQTQKVNLFYFELDSDKEILAYDEEHYGTIKVSVKNTTSQPKFVYSQSDFSIINDKIQYNGSTGKKIADLNKTISYTVSYDDCWEYCNQIGNMKVNTENKKPTLKVIAKQNIYPVYNMNSTKLDVLLNGENINEQISLGEYSLNKKSGSAEYSNLVLTAVKKKNETVRMVLQKQGWTSEITADVKLIVNSSMATVKAEQSTLILNQKYATYDVATTKLIAENATGLSMPRAYVYPSDIKSQMVSDQLNVVFHPDTHTISAQFSQSIKTKESVIKNGTYTYEITPVMVNVFEGRVYGYRSKTIKVKIMVVDKEATLSLNAKGTIDLPLRNTTGITYTSKLVNLNGTVKSVELIGSNKDLFSVSLLENKTSYLQAKDQVPFRINTKYTIYLRYKYETDNGEITIRSKALTVKPIQSNIRVKMAENIVVFNKKDFPDNGDKKLLEVACNPISNNDVSIERMQITGGNGFFIAPMFYTKIAYINYFEEQLQAGKTYTVKINVYFVNGAINAKPATTTLKIKVVE